MISLSRAVHVTVILTVKIWVFQGSPLLFNLAVNDTLNQFTKVEVTSSFDYTVISDQTAFADNIALFTNSVLSMNWNSY